MSSRRQVPYSLLVRLTQALGHAHPNGLRSKVLAVTQEEWGALRLLVEQEKARQQEEAEPGFGVL